jgi:hypothetical protein
MEKKEGTTDPTPEKTAKPEVVKETEKISEQIKNANASGLGSLGRSGEEAATPEIPVS